MWLWHIHMHTSIAYEGCQTLLICLTWMWDQSGLGLQPQSLHFTISYCLGVIANSRPLPKAWSAWAAAIRGSGGKNVIFSNTPQTTPECFKLLYYVPIWFPESLVGKNWPEPIRCLPQTLKRSTLTKWPNLHAILSPFFKSQSICMWII
jgi:hypothetical protein